MNISSDQLRQMEELMQPRYYEYLRAFLREHAQPLVSSLDDSKLLRVISAAVPKAQNFGIETGEGILAYVTLALLRGPNFGDEPNMRKFLTSATDTPDRKLQWVFIRILEMLQEATEASSGNVGPLRP